MVQTDPVALAGLVVELLLALGYLYGVAVANTLHRRRSSIATAAFLGGLAVLAVALQSRLATYDDVVWVHHLQHVLVMSIAPPLLALGAPVTLCLQVLSPRRARGLVALLHHPALRAVCGPRAAWHLPLDYYGVTALYLFTPAHGWSETSTFAHVAVHAVLLTCGLLFWVPIVGVDATGWRPSYRTRLWLAGAGGAGHAPPGAPGPRRAPV